jgi:hypothetical protein
MSKLHPAIKHDILVNSGALQMAINVLDRAGKHEVVEELKKTMKRLEGVNMRFLKIEVSNNVPLYMIGQLIQNQLLWDEGSFSVIRGEFSDGSKMTFVDIPTDLDSIEADHMLEKLSFYFKELSEHFDHKPSVLDILKL